MFLLLITVSSVGPKVAMSVCSQMEPDKLAMAVMSGDVKSLSGVKGLGKKTSERIILELRDKLKKVGVSSFATSPASSIPVDLGSADPSLIDDAINALVVLGYKDDDAREAVTTSYEDGIELQDLIKKKIKKMVR